MQAKDYAAHQAEFCGGHHIQAAAAAGGLDVMPVTLKILPTRRTQKVYLPSIAR